MKNRRLEDLSLNIKRISRRQTRRNTKKSIGMPKRAMKLVFPFVSFRVGSWQNNLI